MEHFLKINDFELILWICPELRTSNVADYFFGYEILKM